MSAQWGFQTVITKAFRSDVGVDLDAFLRESFEGSLKPGMSLAGDIEWEWVDVDESPMNFGFTLEDGTEIPPLENCWMVRGIADVVGGES